MLIRNKDRPNRAASTYRGNSSRQVILFYTIKTEMRYFLTKQIEKLYSHFGFGPFPTLSIRSELCIRSPLCGYSLR